MFKLLQLLSQVETVIRPNYSSAEIAANAAASADWFRARNGVTETVKAFDVSWLPKRVSVPNNQGDENTLDLNPIEFRAIECQDCLVYLSRCYCDDKAA